MKSKTRICNPCRNFKIERDFFARKRQEYERQLANFADKNAEQDRLLNKALKEIAQLKDMISRYADGETEKDQVETIQVETDGQKESEESIRQPHEDIVIKVEPEVIIDEGEEVDRGFDEDGESQLVGKEDREKSCAAVNAEDSAAEFLFPSQPCFQICRWNIGPSKGAPKLCAKVCTISELVSHLTDDHIVPAKKPKPNICFWDNCPRPRPFKYKRDLIRHLQTHAMTARYRCPSRDCNRKFCLKQDLDTHRATHVVEQPDNRYPCSHEGCDKVLPSLNHLKQHEAFHTNLELPCSHPGCPKVFRNVAMMNVHVRRYHTHVAKIAGGVIPERVKSTGGCAQKGKTTQCCCVDGCAAKADLGRISLHLFPKDPDTNRQWRINLHMDTVPRFMRVCSRHFMPNDFFTNPPGWPIGRRGLKPEAVPTQCIPPRCEKATNDQSP